MIVIQCVDLRAAVEQEFSDFGRAGEMQRTLAVAAAGVDQRGICVEQCPDLVDPPEMGGGPDIDLGAARNQSVGFARVDIVENTEAAVLPLAAGIDVAAKR